MVFQRINIIILANSHMGMPGGWERNRRGEAPRGGY